MQASILRNLRSVSILAIVVLFAGGAIVAQSSTQKTRTEKDLLGEKQVPADAYYGVQTMRALENFQLSGIAINHYPGFVEAWAYVKLAAAQANYDVGAMKKDRLDAIEKACNAVIAGKYHDQFQVDWYQGGAGTSTNMNANEVLANIGLELSGHKKGEYQYLEPHDDLNMSQSTNDSYPTAIKVALILRNDKLVEELQLLADSFRAKGKQYLMVVKMGRTELQDAVPMTVGQEFYAFASSLEGQIQLLKDSEKPLYVENMGATAIGTGINVPKGYPEKFAEHLSKLLNKPIVPAPDMIAATWDQQGFVDYSSVIEEPGCQALEDIERLDSADIRATRGTQRDRSAGDPARFLNHAGQGESGGSGGLEPCHVPRDRQRLGRYIGRSQWAASVECLRTGRRRRNDGVSDPALQYVEAGAHQVRRRHRRRREAVGSITWRRRSVS